jgi:hypothetical protein
MTRRIILRRSLSCARTWGRDKTDRPREPGSLCGLLQGAFDEGETALGLFSEKLFAIATIFLRAVEFVGNRQRSQNGYFLRVNRCRGACDRVHFLVDVLCEALYIRLLQFPANRIHLTEDFDFYRTAHVSGL